MENFSLPSDFIRKMQLLLNSEWEDFKTCYENNKYQALRFNPLKKGISPDIYPELLSKLSIPDRTPVPWADHAYYYPDTAHPGKHPWHEAGLYYIQEPSAMSAAALLAPEPGDRVLDLCAAPGGKSTQLAAYLNQTGLLVANEIHSARCKILSQNMERLGISNAIVTNEDSFTLAARFPEYFDKIMVDAPCSGEGMFRKHPEAASEWSLANVKNCAARQSEILDNAAEMLVPGGKIVYSTCTFSPEENEQVIASFLEQHPEFELIRKDVPEFDHGRPDWANHIPQLAFTFRLWPHHLHGEGHFAAILQKKGSSSAHTSGKTAGLKDKNQLRLWQEFASTVLTPGMNDFLQQGNLILFGDQLYRLPEDAPSLEHLKVLRAGLHLGTFKKNRFEPSHALALFLGIQDVKTSISLSLADPSTSMFFNGETINCDTQKGWCLVCIEGFSAGWGKASGGILKNHYPKGLRKSI